MPLRVTERIALQTSRRSTVQGRAHHGAAGSSGARVAHWPSVRSVGYGGQFMLPVYPPRVERAILSTLRPGHLDRVLIPLLVHVCPQLLRYFVN